MVPILITLIEQVVPVPGSTNCPSTLSYLLSIGAEKPLVAALTLLTYAIGNGHDQPQQQRGKLRVLMNLSIVVSSASAHDIAVHNHCAAWPPDLLEAHLCANLKVSV